MKKTTAFIVTATVLAFICMVLINANIASPRMHFFQQGNTVPVVKILKPKTDSVFAFNAPIAYNIVVTDKEDGDSRYDELNAKEILLKVAYSAAPVNVNITNNGAITDAPGLAIMRTNNCFNCHAFNSKLIGPSFYDIVQKYTATAANIAQVGKRVKDGSTGIWGKVLMPTHPELTTAQAQTIVDWILHYAAEAGTDYYVGTLGTFKLKPQGSGNGVYVLTASYIDHGVKADSTKPRLEGSGVMVVRGR